MSTKNKEYQECTKCGERKPLEKDFYISYSPLHKATNRLNICKSCLHEYDYNGDGVFEILRAIDKPYYDSLWKTCLIKSKNNPLSKYIRSLLLNNKYDTWADSDGIANEAKSITRINTEILRKKEELKELEEKTKNIKKDEIDSVPEELIKKWGKGYDVDLYEQFEEKFKLLEQSYPIKSTLHLEALVNYILLSVQGNDHIRRGELTSGHQLIKMAQEQAKQAKIDPKSLTVGDLAGQGIDNFSALATAVEKAVDIVPLIPKYIEQGQDKADMMMLFYVNYERKLRGLPEVTHGEVYDFYNKMIESYIENNPDDYAFLKDTDESLPLVNRVYDWVFNVRIPQAKKENPNDLFYQNLEKWVELVSYLRYKIK